jgi:hypothetical protein
MTAQIKAAAAALAEARIMSERAESVLMAAAGGRTQLSERVAALQAERAVIVDKARAGSMDPALALRMATLDLDIADLGAMVASADSDVTKAQISAGQARQDVASAEWQLSEAKADELESRLLVHAAHLDHLLSDTISDLVASGARKGSRPIWAPSPELAEAIQRAHLNRRNVRQ